MFCKNCGAQIDAEAKFCPACGASNEESVAQPQEQPVYQAQPQPAGSPVSAISILVFGILGIALALEFPPAGIILSIIALDKAKKYSLFAPLTGKAKTGKTLGKIGLILSIVAILLCIVYLVLYVLYIVFLVKGLGAADGFLDGFLSDLFGELYYNSYI